VLALQGDYVAHAEALIEAGALPSLVKSPEDLRLDGQSLEGLILPGGESTTMLIFLERRGLFESLQEFGAARPVFGTCAGAILLAREVHGPAQDSLELLDVSILRNGYGRQLASHIQSGVTSLRKEPVEMVFIRAPIIESVGKGVAMLAESDGHAVLVQQGRILASTFHPELTADTFLHQHFLKLSAG